METKESQKYVVAIINVLEVVRRYEVLTKQEMIAHYSSGPYIRFESEIFHIYRKENKFLRSVKASLYKIFPNFIAGRLISRYSLRRKLFEDVFEIMLAESLIKPLKGALSHRRYILTQKGREWLRSVEY